MVVQFVYVDDQQVLWLVGFVEWFVVGGGELVMVVIECEIGCDVGEQGYVFDDFVQWCQVVQVV